MFISVLFLHNLSVKFLHAGTTFTWTEYINWVDELGVQTEYMKLCMQISEYAILLNQMSFPNKLDNP